MGKRLPLKQMILNEIDKQPRGYAGELAKVAGYSSGGNLKKVLLDEKREFDSIQGLIDLVRFLFSDDEHAIMAEYSKEIDPNNKLARHMLEYLSCNRLLDSMKELIDKMLQCSNKESNEWARVYSLQYEWQNNYHSLDINNHHIKVKDTKSSILELKILLKMMDCNCHYYKNNLKFAYDIIQEVTINVDLMKDDYIKNVFKTKLNEILSYINLWVLNNPSKAINNAEEVIKSNIGETFKAYAHFIIGYAHFYTSYDVAIKNLLESIAIYNSINREKATDDVYEVIDRLNVFWGKKIDADYKFRSLESHLLYKFKNGINIEIELEEKKNKLYEPFYYFLLGLVNNSKDLIMLSMIKFLKDGNTFQANLVKIELLKRGENELVLSELINFNNI